MKALLLHDWTNPPEEIFSPDLRDDLSSAWIELKKTFWSLGVELTATRPLDLSRVDFELHLNARQRVTSKPA
jgi:hypothetical protein